MYEATTGTEFLAICFLISSFCEIDKAFLLGKLPIKERQIIICSNINGAESTRNETKETMYNPIAK